MSTFQRQLRRESRANRLKILKQMRKDMIYLLKPKPRFWPRKGWMWLLTKLLNLKPEDIVNKL